MKHIKARERRYLLMALIFSVAWGIGFARLRHTDVDVPPRDTVDALLQDAQPVLAFESVWVGASVGMSGGLAFVEQRPHPYHRVARLDFETGAVSSLFELPKGALVYHIAATPDAQRLVMSYSPPEARYDYSGLYTVSLTDGTMERVVGGETPATYYTNPHWAGDSLVYTVYRRAAQTRHIERYDVRTGAVNVVAENAVMPMLSADGATLMYVRINPIDGKRSLWAMDTTAESAAYPLVTEDAFADIDVPTLSPDGAWVYFTVLEQPSFASRAAQVVLGAGQAHAHGNHNVPMRWYRVSLGGGEPQPVISDPFITLYGGLNTADELGFVSDTGFYVAQAGRVDQLIQSRVMRSFVWLSPR